MEKIYIVIPAFNEEKTIARVIDDILIANENFQIIIVDDASTDNTVEIAAKRGVKVLRHLINRGQGAALKTGTKYAIMKAADIIVHFDADAQFQANEINDLIKPILKSETDIVFGSRFLEKKSDIPSFKKNFILPVARLFNQIFFGIKLTDPQSGLRAFRASAMKDIDWQQDKMAHCSEILHNAHKNNLKIKEVPITVVYYDFGQKFSGGFAIIKDIIFGKFLK
ncbi:MAG: glycosyltransferase family 2 protein [bacterium]|nr:glycosyltransferase family 2 protein [bacterium]